MSKTESLQSHPAETAAHGAGRGRTLARKGASLMLLLGISLLWAVPHAAAQIEGRYEAIRALPAKNSLRVVQFDEYINFTCPHCNNFRKAAMHLKKKYGKRLRINYRPILFRNQADGPLRLFFIAQSLGRTEEVKDLIFDAAFGAGVNIYDPAVVSYLARTAGLGEIFQREANAEWVTKLVRESHRLATADGVQVTPTIVLQRALKLVPRTGMQAFVGNLDHLIEQLLVKTY